MAERDFDAEASKKSGHTFTLGGQTFHTYPGLSVTYLNRDRTDDENADPMEQTVTFIRSLIVADERDRFDALLSNTDIYIEAKGLLDLSNWLVEVISDRPTKSPASSGNGVGRTSSSSKAKPSPAGGATKR